MSTILKALRRLEKEKAPGDRPLREQVAHHGGDAPAPRRWPILLGGIGAGVVAGLAVLFLVLSRGEAPEQAETAAPAAPAATAPAAPPEAAQPAAPVRKGRGLLRPILPPGAQAPAATIAPAVPAPEVAEPPAGDEVAVIDRGVPPPRVAVETPAANTEVPLPGSVRPFRRADPKALPGRHLLPETTAAPEAPVEPPPAPVQAPPAVAPAPAVVRRAPAPAPPEPAAEPEPPKRVAASPPPPPAPAFPALRVERTTWHPVAERRVAVVDVPGGGTQSVHEGEPVAGAVVLRIEPSGVVFEHAGREVRRKVGQ